MAFDFPNAPTIGQVYGGYSWDGEKWIGATSSGAIYVNDPPPPNAPVNSLWWNSANGTLYVKYNDGNSTQWVALAGGGADAVLYATAQTLTGTQQAQARSNIAAPGLAVPNTFSENITTAKRFITTSTSLNGAQFDNGAVAGITVANASSALALPSAGGGSGFLVAIDETNLIGSVGLFLCTDANQPYLIYSNQAGFVSGANVAGKASFGWDGANFRLYNNVGAGSAIFHVLAFRIS